MGAEVAVAVVSAFVAVLSAGGSAWFSHRATRLAENTARDQYLERVRDWADRTVEVTVAVVRLTRDTCPEGDYETRRSELREAISAQIEKGRWLFPNELREHIGTTKEAAYRGFRQPVLDCLVEIYDNLDGLAWADRASARGDVLMSQRAFVSEIQVKLDPNRRDAAYGLLVDRYQDMEKYIKGW